MNMKRIFILCTVVIGLFLGAKAHPVDQETAKAIACKFMKTNDLRLSSTYRTENNVAAFYIFNTNDGFVIVAADDCETPIIGYSRESQFDPYNTPVQMEDYLQDFVTRIEYGIENQIVADELTTRQWTLVKTTGRLNDGKNVKEVAPLITAKWHQGCLYNSLCPVIESLPCGHAQVGCVAVAMGQIMHYWKFPEIGQGSYSYATSSNGTLSADFGNTHYEWDLMPDTLSEASTDSEIEAVATLLYHCGISVNMYYTSNGSGAYSSDVPDALTNYFRYADGIHRETFNGDMAEWLNKLKECLDKERPVLYSGQGSGGHAFVCDGYDNNDLLHFNWGWGGNCDGYFALGNLNPSGNNYNNSNAAIFDIVPNRNPHLVSASADPPYGGSIEGNGPYQCDHQCTLTAIPAENYEFFYWKQGGQIISYDSTYTLFPTTDIDDIEAVFSLKPAKAITASAPSENIVNLSWSNSFSSSYSLLKEFNIQDAQGIATDGIFLYMSMSTDWTQLMQYTMDGNYYNLFHTAGCNSPTELTFDGSIFYLNGQYTSYLYGVDLTNHLLVSTIRTGNTPICSYDHVNGGIWIANYINASRTYILKLIDQEGTLLRYGPTLPTGMVPNGSGFFVSDEREAHLFIKTEEGKVYDYNINLDSFNETGIDMGTSYGAHIGKYGGKDALFVCFSDSVKIYAIRSHVRPIAHYRLYRADNEGNVTRLADEVIGSSYPDPTWSTLDVGLYKFGISSVYTNGNESSIKWSEPIPKGNYSIQENDDPEDSTVKKIIENGKIVIIKDGKRFNITGQEIQ